VIIPHPTKFFIGQTSTLRKKKGVGLEKGGKKNQWRNASSPVCGEKKEQKQKTKVSNLSSDVHEEQKKKKQVEE